MEILTTTNALPASIRQLLRERISTNLNLPMQSQTAAQVLALGGDEERDVREFTELVERDPALAGHILALSNSVVYAAREPITSLHQAVKWLGISTLCEISVAVSLKSKVFDIPGYATRLRDLWIHSAATAVYARELSRDRIEDADGMFMCGLLHTVGKPVVMQNMSDIVKERTNHPVPKGLMELAMEEFYELVGGKLVAHWEFPEWMITVVRCHRQYDQAGDYRMEACLISLAASLADWALLEGSTEEDFDYSLPAIEDAGLSVEDIQRMIARRGQVLEIADAFS